MFCQMLHFNPVEKDRDSKVIALWLQCYTQEEIEKLTDTPQSTVNRIIEKIIQNGKNAKMDNFTPQLYNIWNFARNNNDLECEGWDLNFE